VTLSLAPDASQASTAVSQFVTAWNKVIGDINTQFAVSPNGTGGGPLEADNNLRDIQNQLLAAISGSISGNSGLVNLASIGINLNTDGTLSLDSGTLSNALNTNFAAVQNLLQGNLRRGRVSVQHAQPDLRPHARLDRPGPARASRRPTSP